jgi:hypothetical protein
MVSRFGIAQTGTSDGRTATTPGKLGFKDASNSTYDVTPQLGVE